MLLSAPEDTPPGETETEFESASEEAGGWGSRKPGRGQDRTFISFAFSFVFSLSFPLSFLLFIFLADWRVGDQRALLGSAIPV